MKIRLIVASEDHFLWENSVMLTISLRVGQAWLNGEFLPLSRCGGFSQKSYFWIETRFWMTHTLYWGWKLLAFLLKVLFRVKPRLTLSIWQSCWILCCYVMSRETQQRPGQALSTLITTFIIVPNTSTTTTNKINEWTKKVVIYIHWCSHEPKNAMESLIMNPIFDNGVPKCTLCELSASYRV